MNRSSVRGPLRHPRRGLGSGALLLVVLVLVPSGLISGHGPTAPRPGSAVGAEVQIASNLNVLDGGTLTLELANGSVSTLTDSETPAGASADARSYYLNISVTLPAANASLRVWSYPVTNWEYPGQFPWGAVALPPLYDWSVTISSGGVDDTANWSVSEVHGEISRQVGWVTQSYLIAGITTPSLALTALPGSSDGTTPTQVGLNVNNAALGGGLNFTDPVLSADVAQLHPTVARFGLSSVGTSASWNKVSGAPKFNFTTFDQTADYSLEAGASIALNLPVGSWGDGNLLPAGMPLDLSMPVPYGDGVGYFPTASAYASYVGAVVAHVSTESIPVRYWLVGNEMPLVNASIVAEYIRMFNVAAETIHATLPSALVGSDSMTNRTYFPQFAANARGVGFLSFHYYPAQGLCEVNGTYCAPNATSPGSPDPRLWASYADMNHQGFLPPATAQQSWKNSTGREIPVLDTESNLNGVGGSPATMSSGTDPRQQSLFGAAWVDSTLVDGSFANLSALTYFMLASPAGVPDTISGPYGGWGFGLIGTGGPNGDIPYAPYLALRLWADAFPAGANGVTLTGGDANISATYAAVDGQNLSVVVVNQVDVPVRLSLAVAGANYTPGRLEVLDNRSYVESYHEENHEVTLGTDSVRTLPAALASTGFTISGYGVAEIRESYAAPTNQSGNSSGGHSSGNQSGNSSGNQSSGNQSSGNRSGGATTSNSSAANSSGNATSNSTHSPPSGGGSTEPSLPTHAASRANGFATNGPGTGSLGGPGVANVRLFGLGVAQLAAGAIVGLAGLVIAGAWREGGPVASNIVGRPSHRPPARGGRPRGRTNVARARHSTARR